MDDPVDRRNAPFVQVLLVCMGVLLPLNKAVQLSFNFAAFRESMSKPGLVMDLSTDALMVAVAWVGFWLVRQGRFRHAVRLYLGVMLFCGALAYAAIGLERLGNNDPFPLLLLGLGGLVLGRRTLWTVYVALMLMFALGAVSDLLRQLPHGAVEWHWGRKFQITLSYFVVAVVLDRTIAALRESLAESNARGRDLQQANLRLENEMAERERAQGQLVHAQKMEAVGRIAGGVAHDFDNVLSVVLGYAQRRARLAEQGVPALVGALDGVERAARRALAISRRLLDFSRSEVLRPERFEVAQAVHELQPMLRQLFDADTRLQLQAEEAGTVCMDRGQFELAVMNVAANARDAMPEGGIFSLCVRCADDAMELHLSDTGCGMSEGVRQHVFEPFYTTKPAGSGTGLGLAVVYDMMRAAGGTISVRSAPDQGSTFVMRLPLSA